MIGDIVMDENIKKFFEKMQEFLPSTREEYCENIKKYDEVLETVLIEDVFMPKILTLLYENKNQDLLKSIFLYFEKIITQNNMHLINILSITVLEILGNDRMILEIAKQYMGPKTLLLQIKADRSLGRFNE